MTQNVESTASDLLGALGIINASIHSQIGMADYQAGAFGELAVSQRMPETGWRFDYGINTDFITITKTGTGDVTNVNSLGVLSTGASAASSASITSKRVLRYQPGRGGLVRFTAVFSAPKEGSTQVIGLGNTNDGFFWGYNGLNFGINRRQGGVDHWIYEADFNGVRNFVPDYTKGNVFQILYQWLGFGNIRFGMENPTTGLIDTVHTIHYPNQAITPSIYNPTLPLYAGVENTTNDTDMILSTPSAMAFIEGRSATEQNPLDLVRSIETEKTFTTSGVEHHVITIRNKATFAAQANRIPVYPLRLNVGRLTGANNVIVRVRKNATFADAMVWTDINATNSPVEYSVTTTTITGGDLLEAYYLQSVTSAMLAPVQGEIVLYAGETVTASMRLSQNVSTDVFSAMKWMEAF